MDNNDILRRLRYTLRFDDRQMIAAFAEVDRHVTRDQVSAWLKRDEDPALEPMDDVELATFLNGLIIQRRGKREGPQAVAEQRLNNNIVLRKLKIAFNFKDADILRLMIRAGFPIGKPELSALFRKYGHKNYRECKDQILRNFLKGLQLEHQTDAPSD